jgi:hypothetical protein
MVKEQTKIILFGAGAGLMADYIIATPAALKAGNAGSWWARGVKERPIQTAMLFAGGALLAYPLIKKAVS